MNYQIVVLLGILTTVPFPAPAQERPVTLRQAVAEARAQSPEVLAAHARAEAARQGGRVAGSFRWPTAGVDAGLIRSDDPVAAFGGRLRQARFAQQDFDPAFLNHPGPLNDWSGGVGAQWAPVDFSAGAAYQAARAEAEAAGLGAAWVERAAAFRAEARYLEAVGAQRTLDAALAALRAAEANSKRAELRLAQGVLMEADVLQATAALQGARARHIDARRAVADARGRLAVAMGWPVGQVPVPTDTTFAIDTPEGDKGDVDLEARADLQASLAGVRAADARSHQASRARLPRVQGFVRLESHAPDAFSNAEDDWTVGFQLQVPLFTGFRIDAMRRAASAMRDATASEHAQRLREAEAQVAEARRAVDAARQGSQAAGAAADAAEEAARLMRRRFEEGMVTTADLLGVEAQAASLRNAAVNAGLGLHLAMARLSFLTDTTNRTHTDGLAGGSNR